MGFRYQKRVKLSKRLGLNISKSGVSASYRTKYGSLGPKRFTIKTGVPGLTYYGSKDGASLLLLIMIPIGLSIFVFKMLTFLIGLIGELLRILFKIKKPEDQLTELPDIHYSKNTKYQ